MNIFEVIILGLTQGLTEFIPVSSSGHLELVQRLLGGGARAEDFHLFLELINFGTLIALLFYYRKRIAKIIGDVFVRKNWHMAINLLLTSIPAGAIGFLLSNFIEENGFFSSIYTIAIAMGVVGLLMIFVEKLPHLSKVESEEKLPHSRALSIGLIQTFALIPGVSRSGSTILAGRVMGMNSKDSANYSFMASIPIMIGVCLKSVVSSSSRAYISENFGMLFLSNFVAFVFGMIALTFVIKFLENKGALRFFGYYRVALAVIALVIFTFC
ncbi:undecaprenyl-diphosphate phosphatase [Candidatus Saccharibacteria bacterium]|nr:undecaprenyl-diphosphate phosphatase [Candidatus Saccharibacteria bacterium]